MGREWRNRLLRVTLSAVSTESILSRGREPFGTVLVDKEERYAYLCTVGMNEMTQTIHEKLSEFA